MKQCRACPWKKSTVPGCDIPDGYDEAKHKALSSTIAEPGILSSSLHLMACHEAPCGSEKPCVGWLAHQLGPGNNIALRMRALDGRWNRLELDGPQHETFEETVPRFDEAQCR